MGLPTGAFCATTSLVFIRFFLPLTTIRHIIVTRTSCFEKYFPIKARNITHKITPALLTNILQKFFSPARTCVFHEKFESLNYRLWGYTPEIVGGINFGQNYKQEPQQLHNKTILGMYSEQWLWWQKVVFIRFFLPLKLNVKATRKSEFWALLGAFSCKVTQGPGESRWLKNRRFRKGGSFST